MKQFIVGKTYGNSIGSQSAYPVYTPLRGQDWANNDADTTFRHSHPWSVAGSFRNLYVEISHPAENPVNNGWPAIDFELYINDAPTGLKVTVPAGASGSPTVGLTQSAVNTTITAPILPGDRVALTRGVGTIAPGFNQFTVMVAWSMTFESTNPGESGYGVSSYASGNLGQTNLLISSPFVDPGGLALASEAINAPTTHSIVPFAGAVTRLDVGLYVAPGMGNTRTLAMMLNGVVQDGSGGTVDTRSVVSDAATTAFLEFTLPVQVLDRLTVCQLVGGGATASLVTYAIRMLATVDGQSALGFQTGNANPTNDGTIDFAGGSDGGWAQTTARAPIPSNVPARWPMSELSMSLPGPIDPFALSSLCGNFSSPPGTGKSYALTTRRASADTPATLTMADADVLSVGVGLAGSFATPSDRLDLQSIAASTPHATSIAWTWLVVAPSQVTTVKSHSGSFFQGQQGASFTVVVTNTSDTVANGATVTETLPAGLTLVSMVGIGWTVVGNVATRSDALSPGGSYPPLTVTVNVAADATSPQCNQANEAVDCVVIGIVRPFPIVSTRRWAINRFDARPKGGQQA
jgi:uncharacterized repeat protein (TIGR01451 family)